MSVNFKEERTDASPAVRTTLGLLPVIAVSAALSGPSFAQEQGAQGVTELGTITVEGGAGPANANEQETNLGRIQGTVKDTPQVVNVISKETLEQQRVQTLEQALKNVPGITMGAGEGNGGLNGDQFRIRGFEAKGDIYNDGLRDFGVYVRDSFAFESVQVFKGPSSENFGMGTTGGAINTTTKRAHLGDEYSIEGQAGNGPFGRVVIDVNKEINETTAVRAVATGRWQDLAGRDHVYSNSTGFLGAAAFGIGEDLTWDLSYMYQRGDRKPDAGVPMAPFSGTASKDNPSRPVTEFGVPRSVFYGKEQDHDVFNTHVVTSKLKWDANENLTLYNDTRLSVYDRDFATSIPGTTATGSEIQAGLPAFLSNYGGGNPTFKQNSWGIQNITTGVAKFETGALRHELVFGLDVFYQDNERKAYSVSGKDATLVNLYNPGATYYLPYTVTRNPANDRKSTGTSVGLFASDRVWFTPEVSVLGGVRWDHYKASYDTATASLEETTSTLSPKLAFIWEPTPDQTYYVSWARSFTPPGQFVANAANALGNQPSLEPETSDLYEVGGKINLFDGMLGINGALFQVTKSNAYYTDPTTGDLVETGEKQRVRGFEIGVSGRPTDAWTVGVSYSRLDSEILTSTTAENVGNRVANSPENAVSLWTSYELTKHLDIEGKLDIGGGITYRDEYYTNSANSAIVPESFSLDAFVSYEYKNFNVALNAYNLTNRVNYNGSHNNRAIVEPARTFVLTVGAKF